MARPTFSAGLTFARDGHGVDMPPRERYAAEGPRGFGDTELLALILGSGSAGRSTLQIATSLLDRFGGLRGVALRDPNELRTVPGVGLERAVRVHAALQAGRRSLREELRPEPVTCARDAWRLLAPALRGRAHEELHGLFLDRRRRPLARRRLTYGSDRYTVVDARQVYRVAIAVGACAVILAHNHPSGDPEPSPQDHWVTQVVVEAGAILGIPLLDHLVVGEAGYRSLADDGVLEGWNENAPGRRR